MDQRLFEALIPRFPRTELVRYDGQTQGSIVWMRLHLPLLPAQDWRTTLTEVQDNGRQAWFIDESDLLPFFLARWHHRHVVASAGDTHSTIIDDVTFDTPWWLPAWLLFPVLWAQFAARKPAYRRYFAR